MDYYKNSSTNMKPEAMDIAATVPEGTTEKVENGGKRLPWQTGAVRKKRRKTPAEKNLRLKKYVQPKNAVMCLNELVQSVQYVVEEEGTGSGKPCCVSVSVNDQTFRGFGTSKQMAKQAAAEAALVSFVKAPGAGAGAGAGANASTDEDTTEDRTPWAVLASFAMFKLFSEWREGRIGMYHPPSAPFGMPMIQDATMSKTLQNILTGGGGGGGMSLGDVDMKQDGTSNVMSAHLGKENARVQLPCSPNLHDQKDDKHVQNPAKEMPKNSNSMNPVMLLHQMRPLLVFTQETKQYGDTKSFVVACQIDGKSFTGEGSSIKKAKLELAKEANSVLFGVATSYVAIN